MSKTNYYDVLGVPHDCDQHLIHTVYKSTVRIFHPDVFKGDKVFAQDKLKTVNEAYAVLGDVDRRNAYNAELGNSDSSDATEEIYENETEENPPFDDIYSDEWKVIVGYFPEIDLMYKSLRKINANLSLSFKFEIISKKNYRNANVLFQNIKQKFFVEKFGKNPNVHRLVMSAIETGNRKFALDLNKDLTILGENECTVILLRLLEKHREFCIDYFPQCGFERLLGSRKSLEMQIGGYRIGQKFFRIDSDCVRFAVVRFGFIGRFEKYDSVEGLIRSGRVSETEVLAATKSF